MDTNGGAIVKNGAAGVTLTRRFPADAPVLVFPVTYMNTRETAIMMNLPDVSDDSICNKGMVLCHRRAKLT